MDSKYTLYVMDYGSGLWLHFDTAENISTARNKKSEAEELGYTIKIEER